MYSGNDLNNEEEMIFDLNDDLNDLNDFDLNDEEEMKCCFRSAMECPWFHH